MEVGSGCRSQHILTCHFNMLLVDSLKGYNLNKRILWGQSVQPRQDWHYYVRLLNIWSPRTYQPKIKIQSQLQMVLQALVLSTITKNDWQPRWVNYARLRFHQRYGYLRWLVNILHQTTLTTIWMTYLTTDNLYGVYTDLMLNGTLVLKGLIPFFWRVKTLCWVG